MVAASKSLTEKQVSACPDSTDVVPNKAVQILDVSSLRGRALCLTCLVPAQNSIDVLKSKLEALQAEAKGEPLHCCCCTDCV